jgi:hypothetical protein
VLAKAGKNKTTFLERTFVAFIWPYRQSLILGALRFGNEGRCGARFSVLRRALGWRSSCGRPEINLVPAR